MLLHISTKYTINDFPSIVNIVLHVVETAKQQLSAYCVQSISILYDKLVSSAKPIPRKTRQHRLPGFFIWM